MSRRSEIEITNDILKLCRVPTIKTHIVYKCNMNFHTIERYLKMLIREKLILVTRSSGQVLYETTEHGIVIIDNLDSIIPTIQGLKIGGY